MLVNRVCSERPEAVLQAVRRTGGTPLGGTPLGGTPLGGTSLETHFAATRDARGVYPYKERRSSIQVAPLEVKYWYLGLQPGATLRLLTV